MKKTSFKLFLVIFFSFGLIECDFNEYYEEEEDKSVKVSDSFSPPQTLGKIKDDEIDEASGLAYCRSYPNALWTHNDSGGKCRIYLIDEQGRELGVFNLKIYNARDLEDIAIGPGPKKNINYIYLADMGDNKARYNTKVIFRFPEPQIKKSKLPVLKNIVKDIDIIEFQYPDGKRDAETLMIDPLTKDIYIVSKREKNVHIYQLPYPQSTNKLNIPKLVGKLHFTKAVAGDISADGSEILIKNYANIYYWKRKEGESIVKTLRKKPVRLPYKREPQGEAIAWKSDGSGYYTLSEELNKMPSVLYYYSRKENVEVKEK